MKNYIKKNVKTLIISMIMVIFIAVYFVISVYSRPCVDDFTYGAAVHNIVKNGNYNVFDILKTAFTNDLYYYNHWQGLYTSAFILSLQPGVFSEKLYFIGVLLLLILVFLCIVYFFSTIKKFYLNNINVLAVSLTVFSFLLCQMPSICQGIYWFNGAWNYTPFFFLTLVMVSLIIKNYYAEQKKDDIAFVIKSSLLGFIISGGNHITGFLNILLLISLSVVFLIKKKKKIIVIPLIISIVGYLLVFIAPGTLVRQNQLGDTASIVSTIIHGIYGFYYYSANWINIRSISFLIVIMYLLLKDNILAINCSINPLIFVLISIIIIIGLLCVPYMAMKTFGDIRVENVIWETFIFFLIFNLCYLFLWAKQRNYVSINISESIISMIIILFFVIIYSFSDSNLTDCITELNNGTAKNYAEVFDKRIDYMNNEIKDLYIVEKLPDSKILKFNDISSTMDDYRNGYWESYYNVKMITNE